MKKIRKSKVRAVRSAKRRGGRKTLHEAPPSVTPPYILGEVPSIVEEVPTSTTYYGAGVIASLNEEQKKQNSLTLNQMDYVTCMTVPWIDRRGFWSKMWASFRGYFGKRRKA